jgi:invasion protein IalB
VPKPVSPDQAKGAKAAAEPGKPADVMVAGNFGQWALICGKDKDKDGKEPCSLVEAYGPKGNLVLRVDGPTGVALQKGLEFSPDAVKIYRLQYQACIAQGCSAFLLMPDELKQELTKSPKGTITVYALKRCRLSPSSQAFPTGSWRSTSGAPSRDPDPLVRQRSGHLLCETLGDEGLTLGAIVILVDEEEIVGGGKAHEFEPAGFGEPLARLTRCRKVTPVRAEALLLQLAARHAELAGQRLAVVAKSEAEDVGRAEDKPEAVVLTDIRQTDVPGPRTAYGGTRRSRMRAFARQSHSRARRPASPICVAGGNLGRRKIAAS